MRIKIKNYNNISGLDYEIKERKVNLLFDVSESGKSSIASV